MTSFTSASGPDAGAAKAFSRAGATCAPEPEQLRDGYLNRLRRLLRLRRDHFEELNEQGLRLLDRSIFAAYCDCLDIGQGDAAKSVLKDVRLTLSLTRASKR